MKKWILVVVFGVAACVEQTFGQIIITELGNDGSSDWIEIYNAGGSPVDIQSYQLDDLDGNAQAFTTASCILAAGQYAVFHYLVGTDEVGADPDGSGNQNGYVDLYATAGLNNPNNDGDQQLLRDGSSTIVDAVTWMNASFPTGEQTDVDEVINAGVWTDYGTTGADIGDVVNVTGWTTTASIARYLSIGPAKYQENDDKTDWYRSNSPSKGSDNDQTLPVMLSLFAATVSPKGVTLVWRTESEIDNLGFEIFRRDGQDTAFGKLPVFVPGAGSSTITQDYEYVDSSVLSGRDYIYLLTSVNTAGQREQFGPVAVTIDAGGPRRLEGDVPVNFSLQQNYPNPFAAGTITTIDFAVPQPVEKGAGSQRIAVNVYDLLGRQIARLSEAALSTGHYRVSWNGAAADGRLLPAGVYFYELQGTDFRMIRKMTIVR